jgi:predicted transcriptional regulator
MFHIIRGMEGSTTEKIAQELDRTYKTVLDFVHEVQNALDEDPEFGLYGICEADEIYVVAGEKGVKQESPRERGLKKRDEERSTQTNRQS